jgi:outer membrane lipoprotein-sorting protein
MKTPVLALVLVASCLTAPTPAIAQADSPERILARSDEARSIPDMSFDVALRSYDGDRKPDESSLRGVLKLGLGADHDRVLMYFTQPASSRGQKLLVDGDSVYILFPRTTNPIRLSPLEVLSGQASDGDVIRTFARDYDVVAFAEESLDGAPAYRFSLAAKAGRSDSSYKRVRLWLDKGNYRLVYAEYYAASGVLLKKAYYRDYASAMGKYFPMTVDIYSGQDARKRTTMSFSSIGRQSLPDTAFRRSYLNSWIPREAK